MDSRSVTPPMSTTSLPSSTAPLSAPAPRVNAPILASDILREEVAPLAPASSAMRRCLLALSIAYGLLAAGSFVGWLPSAPFAVGASLVTAGAAAVAWPGPVPYWARAALATLAGLLPLVLGTHGRGPLALMGSVQGDMESVAALVLVSLLPAALFFRAQYRAFRAARGFLVVALALAAPAVFFLGQGALAGETPVALRIADVLLVMAVLASLAGFLGPETTGACTIWGAVLLAALPARQLVVSALGHAGAVPIASAAGAIGEALAGTVASIGLYQLLAAALARRARMVDVHRIVGPSAEEE
jgi:hypothetical protein